MTDRPGRRQVLRSLGASAVALASGAVGAGRVGAHSSASRDGGSLAPVAPFDHERIDPSPPTAGLCFVEAADLTDSGRDDVIVGASGAPTNLWLFGERTELPSRSGISYELGSGDPTVFWYENPGWRRHEIATVPGLSATGTLADLTGNGRLDLVIGRSENDGGLRWFEQPANPRDPWRANLIADRGAERAMAFEDVDDDGHAELVGLSPATGALWYYDVPDDPYREPWPADHRHLVTAETAARGVRPIDYDGDGHTELLAGGSLYRRPYAGHEWNRVNLTAGYERTRVEAADLDRDGFHEVVFAESGKAGPDASPGRLVWFDPPARKARLLWSGVGGLHSLRIADFDRDGWPDVFIAERPHDPNRSGRLVAYLNRRGVGFRRRVISAGVPTRRATIADLTGDGSPDIVAVSSGAEDRVDAWLNPG